MVFLAIAIPVLFVEVCTHIYGFSIQLKSIALKCTHTHARHFFWFQSSLGEASDCSKADLHHSSNTVDLEGTCISRDENSQPLPKVCDWLGVSGKQKLCFARFEGSSREASHLFRRHVLRAHRRPDNVLPADTKAPPLRPLALLLLLPLCRGAPFHAELTLPLQRWCVHRFPGCSTGVHNILRAQRRSKGFCGEGKEEQRSDHILSQVVRTRLVKERGPPKRKLFHRLEKKIYWYYIWIYT